jgi:hypothetical protein
VGWCRMLGAISAVLLSVPGFGANLEFRCSVPEADFARSRFFQELQIKALEVNETVCLDSIRGSRVASDQNRNSLLLAFGIEVRKAATDALAGLPIDRLWVPFDHFIEQLSQGGYARLRLPEFTVEVTGDEDEWLIFHFDDPVRSGRIRDEAFGVACQRDFGANCDEVLDDLAAAINNYKYSYESLTAADTVAALDGLAEQWDRFLDAGRSQTLLDLSLTTVFERRHLRRGFLVAPPNRQWSLLHPDVAFEHAGDASSGERDQLTVVVEWIGVNWWGEVSPIGIPFGVSLASVYADRPAIGSVGHGLVFHLDNKYSIGWTSRSGRDSILVSIDLLQLIDNKRERLKRYQRKLQRP